MRSTRPTLGSRAPAALVALAAALVAGCAALSTGGGPRTGAAEWETIPGSDEIVIRVRNQVSPSASAQVSLLPTARPEEFLGTVQAGERRAFLVETDLFGGSYFLLAEKSGGGHIVSREIDLLSRAIVTWELATNLIRVERVGG